MSRKKLWAGGYSKGTAEIVDELSESISFDYRLAPFEIRISMIHAEGLSRAGIITKGDAKKIRRGLAGIARDMEAGRFEWDTANEDIHMNIEKELTRRIGETGMKIHAGRSRNDLVATSFRMYSAAGGRMIASLLTEFSLVLAQRAEEEAGTLMPGFTHMQSAQPVTLGHHLLSHLEAFARDIGRFTAAADEAMSSCPLGSAALAGTTLPIDRRFLASSLGFKRPSPNSIDSVSDRDFALDLLHAAALTGLHLSRLGEEIVLWAGPLGFAILDEAVTTGSSIMPQKRNPDVAELARGKAGRLIGNLVSLMNTLKGLPLAYNRDLQEDKEPVFDSVETLVKVIAPFSLMVSTMRFVRKKMRGAIDPSSLATDLAEELVRGGMPFREAHASVARIAADLAKEGIRLDEAPIEPLGGLEPPSPERAVRSRNGIGMTAPRRVRAAARAWVKRLGGGGGRR